MVCSMGLQRPRCAGLSGRCLPACRQEMGGVLEIDDQIIKASILVAVVAVHALLLLSLGSRRTRHRVVRFILWALSTAYFPLMSYVLSYLTTYLSSLGKDNLTYLVLTYLVLTSIILIQFLKAKADMVALSMAAVTSPVAGDDDINSLKIRPSMESLISSFWVAGLVIYQMYLDKKDDPHLDFSEQVLAWLWALGASRMVLRFVAFKRAASSYALGRNVQLIDSYMAQLQQQESGFDAEGQLRARVPPLIVTGERSQYVEESPQGYRVKHLAMEDSRSSLVTLDRVWSEPQLVPELKDLCLAFALFKCLRRRFAGYRLAEAGSGWAFRFVCDGLVGQEDNHERVFRVIGNELTFASDFYYSHLPVASLGTLSAAIHFFLSFLIFALLVTIALTYLALIGTFIFHYRIFFFLPLFVPVIAFIASFIEVSEMVASVRSNWTKISIIGHHIRCRSCCVRRILSCLLRRKSPKYWKDEIWQIELLRKPSLSGEWSWARLFKLLFFPWKIRHKPVIKVSPVVKATILTSFRSSRGQLSGGTTAVQRHGQAFHHDITWACHGGEAITTITDTILVWCIATSLFDIKCSSQRASVSSSAMSDKRLIACSLSRYCMYLVAEAPELLPDSAVWAKHRYKAVKKDTEAASSRIGALPEADVYYRHLIDSFDGELSHEVLRKGSKLGKQLVDEAAERRQGEAGAGGEDEAVWELLAEFWSEMVLYLAPSDNVKAHIEALQRGGELITLLWALLLHAGVTSRPAPQAPEP
ncbi:hypothetical protein ACP70R_008631 [Stipagrostis hirtigluma subsp. patula]